MSDINVLALVGSLRAASVNLQIAQVASENGPDGVSVAAYDGLGDVPFYNEDIGTGADAPVAAQNLRAAVADADAVLVITPEYNASMPAVVKNAIDWLSRPYGESAVTAKPLAVIGASAGQYGGVWAHDETRKSFGGAGARGRYGPVFPRTPACYGFSIIAKVKEGREDAIREHGKTIQEAITETPEFPRHYGCTTSAGCSSTSAMA